MPMKIKYPTRFYRAVFSDGTVKTRDSIREKPYTHAWLIKWIGKSEELTMRGFSASFDLAHQALKVEVKRLRNKGYNISFQEVVEAKLQP